MSLISHPIVEHIPGLRRYARALTGGKKENADDLVQDTLERAYVKWHLFRLGSDLRPWLFSIMHNVFVSEMRRHKQRVLLEVIDHDTIRQAPASHEDYVQVRETLRAMSQLAPELREVLVLVSVETFSYAETARILDIPIGTVMSRLYRARIQLRLLTGDDRREEGRSGLRLVESGKRRHNDTP